MSVSKTTSIILLIALIATSSIYSTPSDSDDCGNVGFSNAGKPRFTWFPTDSEIVAKHVQIIHSFQEKNPHRSAHLTQKEDLLFQNAYEAFYLMKDFGVSGLVDIAVDPARPHTMRSLALEIMSQIIIEHELEVPGTIYDFLEKLHKQVDHELSELEMQLVDNQYEHASHSESNSHEMSVPGLDAFYSGDQLLLIKICQALTAINPNDPRLQRSILHFTDLLLGSEMLLLPAIGDYIGKPIREFGNQTISLLFGAQILISILPGIVLAPNTHSFRSEIFTRLEEIYRGWEIQNSADLENATLPPWVILTVILSRSMIPSGMVQGQFLPFIENAINLLEARPKSDGDMYTSTEKILLSSLYGLMHSWGFESKAGDSRALTGLQDITNESYLLHQIDFDRAEIYLNAISFFEPESDPRKSEVSSAYLRYVHRINQEAIVHPAIHFQQRREAIAVHLDTVLSYFSKLLFAPHATAAKAELIILSKNQALPQSLRDKAKKIAPQNN